jgi:hypothetical protein
MPTLADKQNQTHERGAFNQTRSKFPAPNVHHHVHTFPGWQRSVGNRAVQRLMQSQAGNRRGGSNSASARVLSNQSIQQAAEHGTAGSGNALPHLNTIQRAFGHHDVSHSRAHHGPRAAAAARSMGASAYTFGDQVAFTGTPNLHTAAHEAAHVVQQGAGVQLSGDVGKVGDVYERHADAVADLVVQDRSAEPLLNQMAPAGLRSTGVQRQVVQRTPIETDYGEFDTTTYSDVGPRGGEQGVDMVLTFDPHKTKVDAKKIGLVQSVHVKLAGTSAGWYPVEHERRVPSGTGAGSQIDRFGGRAHGNPLFATGLPGAQDKLGDTATNANYGQHGWNYKDGTADKHQIAILKDTPTARGHGNNSSQTFETTALAVEGTQSGTYMGSVTWGWSVDGSGKFTRDPLTRKSKGKPSKEFAEAAKQWNKTAVGGTVTTTAASTNIYDATYSNPFTVDKGTELQIRKGAWVHNDEAYDLVGVTKATKPGLIGRIGVVRVNDMKESGGTPVIKLPVP